MGGGAREGVTRITDKNVRPAEALRTMRIRYTFGTRYAIRLHNIHARVNVTFYVQLPEIEDARKNQIVQSSNEF